MLYNTENIKVRKNVVSLAVKRIKSVSILKRKLFIQVLTD